MAWLATAALWLTIVAPVISQTLASSATLDLASINLGAWCTGHGLDAQHPGAPVDPASVTERCGYCGLLGHSPLLPNHIGLPLPPAARPAEIPTAQTAAAQLRPRLLSARPRGPPSLI